MLGLFLLIYNDISSLPRFVQKEIKKETKRECEY